MQMNKMHVFLKMLFLFLGMFFITLRAYYFYNIGLSPFPIVGIFFLFLYFLFCKGSLVFDKNIIIWTALLISAILLSTIDPILNTQSFNIASFFGISLGLLIFICFYTHEGINYEDISKVIKWVLFFHLIVFFYQFISFHVFGKLIDLIEPITGHPQRGIGYINKEYGGMAAFRATGLFDEPASYCTYMLALSFVAFYNSRKVFLFEIVVLASVVLTLSLTGFALALVYLLTKRSISSLLTLRNIFVIISGLVLIASSFGDLLVGYATQRINNIGNDSSANIRVNNFSSILDLTSTQIITGSGVGNNPIDIVEYTFPSLIVTFGFLGGALISVAFVLIFNRKLNLRMVIFFCFMSLNFYTLFNPFTWLFASTLIVVVNKKSLRSGEIEL